MSPQSDVKLCRQIVVQPSHYQVISAIMLALKNLICPIFNNSKASTLRIYLTVSYS
jgi:hypothetical protein